MAPVSPWDFIAPGTAEITILSACRVGGLVLVAPMFASKTVPMPLRTAILLVLTIVMQPAAQAHAVAGATLSPATFLTETLIGFSLGFGAALLVGAAELSADLASQAIGLSGATVLDPMGGHQTSVLGSAFALLGATLLLTTGGHLVMLDAVAASFDRVPVGAVVSIPNALLVLLQHGAVLFVLGLQIAAPVIATALITHAGLGVMSRAVPQLNLINLAFPLQIAIGLFTLAASLPFLGLVSSGWGEQVRTMGGDVLSALLRAPR